MTNRVYRLVGRGDGADSLVILCDACADRRGDAVERCASCGEHHARCSSCGFLADLRGRRIPHEGDIVTTPWPSDV